MSTDSRVYQYGLLPPTVNADLVQEQLWEAHHLYNDCIALLRWKGESLSALREKFCPELSEAKKRLGRAKAELEEQRTLIGTLRSRKPAGAEAKQEHAAHLKLVKERGRELSARVKKCAAELKALREGLSENAAYQKELEELQVEVGAKRRAIYKDKVTTRKLVFWSTFNLASASAEQAYRTSYESPRFRRWSGDGQLGVQLQTKLPAAQVFDGTSSFFQLDPIDPRAWDPSVPKGERKRLRRTKMRLRILSGERGKPIWAEWPIILHRPFPEGAVIPAVTVNRRMRAGREIWTAQVTVLAPGTALKTLPDDPKMIALDLGWRKKEGNDLRVAYWLDSEGASGELCLPATYQDRRRRGGQGSTEQETRKLRDEWEAAGNRRVLSHRDKLQMAKSIQSKRDRDVDELKLYLRRALKGREDLDPDLKADLRYMHLWRAPRRFVGLLRKHGDKMPEAVRQHLQQWHLHDKHHWQYEHGCRLRALRSRRDHYRNFAAQLVRDYDVIVIEKFRTSKVAKKPKPEQKVDLPKEEAAMHNAASNQRTEAAPGEFQTAIKQAAARVGVRVLEVGAANTSRKHAACGYDKPWKTPHELKHTCEGCGETFDRDANAAQNILARGRVKLAEPPAAPKERKAKWHARHKPEPQKLRKAA